MPELKSVAGTAARSMKAALLEMEIRRRTQMLDGIAMDDRMRQIARQDMQDQRQAEQDKLANERYNTERADKLMERADDQGQRYLANEREDVQRNETEKQRNLDRADAAGQQYQDAELRRQDQDADRAFHASENEKQRANARAITHEQMSGGKKADDNSGDRAGTVLDALDELSEATAAMSPLEKVWIIRTRLKRNTRHGMSQSSSAWSRHQS